jgi:COP9 signalosome complex subunit 6
VKDVHKSPALDLVGWYAIVPTSGPQPQHVAIQTQLSSLYSESTVLLGFHPSAVLEGSVGGKLPLTIYEANVEPPETSSREDVEMTDTLPSLKVTFKELPYSVETGEAEMIGIDFVAKGGGNATAVETVVKKPSLTTEAANVLKGKKRQEPEDEDEKQAEDQNILSREEEELVSSLTAKANAIKMLHARINLITAYLENLPLSYIASGSVDSLTEAGKDYTTINHSILRSIQALLNRLALLIPSDKAAFSQELLAEQNDVNLISLLNTITDSVKVARDAGRKFAIVEQARNDRKGKQGNSHEWPSGFSERSLGRNIGGVGDLLS